MRSVESVPFEELSSWELSELRQAADGLKAAVIEIEGQIAASHSAPNRNPQEVRRWLGNARFAMSKKRALLVRVQGLIRERAAALGVRPGGERDAVAVLADLVDAMAGYEWEDGDESLVRVLSEARRIAEGYRAKGVLRGKQ